MYHPGFGSHVTGFHRLMEADQNDSVWAFPKIMDPFWGPSDIMDWSIVGFNLGSPNYGSYHSSPGAQGVQVTIRF